MRTSSFSGAATNGGAGADQMFGGNHNDDAPQRPTGAIRVGRWLFY